MTAESFASPRLLAAARAAAPFLAAIPRVPQIGVARRPADKGVIRLFVPRTPRERRMLQAAEYFVSRHPQCTRAERVRFGRAHGYAAAEFARAVRAARANLQQGSSARPEQRIHRPCVAGSNPAPAPFGSLPIAKANERRGGACENMPASSEPSRVVRENSPAASNPLLRRECQESRGNNVWGFAADAGSCAINSPASRSVPHSAPASCA